MGHNGNRLSLIFGGDPVHSGFHAVENLGHFLTVLDVKVLHAVLPQTVLHRVKLRQVSPWLAFPNAAVYLNKPLVLLYRQVVVLIHGRGG